MADRRDPMSLANRVAAILVAHEDTARDAGLHPHTMRRELETAVEAYRQAVSSNAIATMRATEERANALAADIALSLAHAAIRLLEEGHKTASEGRIEGHVPGENPPASP